MSLSPTEIYARASEDFLYFAPRGLKIKDKDGAIASFLLNRAQRYLHSRIEEQLKTTGMVRVIGLKGRQQGFCLAPDTRVLTADLRWIPISEVREGERLVASDENPAGCARKMRTSTVEKIWHTRQPSYRITFDDGRSVVCSGNHRWLTHHGQKGAVWRSINPTEANGNGLSALVPGRKIRSVCDVWGDPTFDDAWFGGMIDGEGSMYSGGTGADVAVSQRAGKVFDRMVNHCESRGYDHYIISDDGPRKTKLGQEPVHAVTISNMKSLFRLIGLSRPTRFVGREWWEGKRMPDNGWRTIISIEPVGEMDLIDIQTSTSTFIAEGLVSHNSTYTEGRFFWRVSGRPGVKAYILTHLAEATQNLFGMTKLYQETCHAFWKKSTTQTNANTMEFGALNSKFEVATAGSRATGRSGTAQYFHGSEVAFWPNAEDHMAGIGQTVPRSAGTEIILESTANGVGNLFHSMWMDAEAGRSEYIPVFVPWMWQNEYRATPIDDWRPTAEDAEYGRAYGVDIDQLYWRHLKISGDFRNDAALFDQEYPATPALAFRRVAGDPLIPVEMVIRARANKDQEATGAKVMGVDPAEYGDDDTAISVRQGRKAFPITRYHGKGPMEVAGIVARHIERERPDVVNVDATGVGSGVADRLREMGFPVNRVHFGERAIDDTIYVLRRDEMWGEMKKWLEDIPNSLPDDDRLQIDLTGPQYTYDSSRRLKLESKEAMRKRGLKSPDSADGLALTFATPAVVRQDWIKLRNRPAQNWRVA